MSALDQIRDLSVTVETIANHTVEALSMISNQLSSTRLMVLQNRAALDYLLAAAGGTCTVIGMECCTEIIDSSENITDILDDMHENIDKLHKRNSENWDPLCEWLGNVGSSILKYSMTDRPSPFPELPRV